MPECQPQLSVIHADMDAFFAAVEVLDDPSIAGLPLIIGHPTPRGVVSTASYEARALGVHSAMPSMVALSRCPQGIWRQPRPGRYGEVSRQVREVFLTFTPIIEPLSVDEAFLDIRGSSNLFGGAVALATTLKERVKEVTGGLTISVGVAENKFLAKVASDLDKPDGLTVVPPGEGEAFLAPLGVRRLWGVGPRTGEHLASLGLSTIGDVVRVGESFLEGRLGKNLGQHLWNLARGIDGRALVSDREARSISTERTFTEDLHHREEIADFLRRAAEEVAASLRKEKVRARTLRLKVRSGSFRTFTRSTTLDAATDSGPEIYRQALILLDRVDLGGEGVRLLGIAGAGLLGTDAPVQQQLFSGDSHRSGRVEKLIDEVNIKEGEGTISRARLLPPAEGERS